jgi:hypothetical protein
MFGWSRGKPNPLDTPIAGLIADMQSYSPETKEYATLLAELERLYQLKTEQRRQRVSADTMMIVMGNIVGILIIVSYERGNVMASKAKEYLIKPKS